MNYLAFDTSSRYLSVIAQKGEKIATSFIPDCAMQHSVMLMDEIDKCLDKLSLTPKECDFFAAVVGPGSFTGIRIGIATAKGFSLATGKKLKPITSFDMIAYNVNAANFVIAIDAAHEHYYIKGYGAFACEPMYISKEQLIAIGADIYGFERLDLPKYTAVNLDGALKKAVEMEPTLGEDMYALYVRKSQAEEAYGR